MGGVLGASLGVAAAAVPIAVASWCGRRWPLYPGDATMLGALGFLLGVPGLAWTMLLGSGFALVYRFCVQRRRGRPFRKGLVPLGPGMCAGAAVVFLCIDCGVALAEDGAARKDPAPVPAAAAIALSAPLPATELGPVLPALPAALAAREVVVEGDDSLPFPGLVRRLSALSGVAMTIEERPARVAGGAVALADPPQMRLAFRGTLAGLLDRVAGLSGYDWSWETLGPEDGAVVFHRYWDADQRGPAPHGADIRGRRADRPRRGRRVRPVGPRAPGPSTPGNTGACAGRWRAGPPVPAGPWSGRRSATTAWARPPPSGAASSRRPTCS